MRRREMPCIEVEPVYVFQTCAHIRDTEQSKRKSKHKLERRREVCDRDESTTFAVDARIKTRNKCMILQNT